MKTFLYVASLSGGALLCSLALAQSDLGTQPMGRSESMQMSQDTSPKARAQLSRREAHAAYKEAMQACKSMAQSERKDCTAEAKRNLNQDLSYAKDMLKPGASMGPSSSRESGMSGGGMRSGGDSMGASGTGRMSGMNDMSGAGNASSGASAGGSTGGSARGSVPEASMQRGQPASMTSSEPVTAAEKQQLVQSFTPQARYNLAKREAQAAYGEAVKECKSMSGAERSSCTKEARANLQQDLAYAKRQMQQGSIGASGAGASDNGTSGSRGR